MNRHTSLPAILAAVFWVLVPGLRAQYCDFPPKELTEGERREYRGLYENKAYGYSIVIPADLAG
jgi:hypothetical protein